MKYYGSDAEARRYVAFSDGNVCSSRHCAVAALNVADYDGAMVWLHQVVGCITNGAFERTSSCNAGTKVLRLQLYGFSAPIPSNQNYLEYALPLVNS